MRFVFLAWVGVFCGGSALAGSGSLADRLLSPVPAKLPISVAVRFDCANVSCKKLRSCEEACYKLKVCGQASRDGDNDGIPCENLCSKPCPD